MTPHAKHISLVRPAPARGFTLVEAVVIMGMLAILLAMSGTALVSWMDRADLKRATRNLVSTLQYARVQAIKENRTIQVKITPTGWSVVRKQQGDIKLRSFSLKNLRKPISSNSTTTIGFRGNGRPETASNTSIRLTSSAGNKMTITMSSVGRIKVERK